MKSLVQSLVAAAALAALAMPAAQAQPTKTDKSASQTTGEMSPQQKADEGVVKAAKPAVTKDRAEVKKEAVAARKAGKAADGECSPEQKADAGACKKEPATTATTRAEVKKEAAAANKSGATTRSEEHTSELQSH